MPASHSRRPLDASSLSFGYDEAEDRLVLLASDAAGAAVPLLLTRRLTGRLINGLAGVLEQSSPVANKVPSEMRDDVILLEHQGALYGDGKADAAPSPSAATQPKATRAPARLVTSIDVATLPKAFEIALRDPAHILARFRVNRLELHRILEAISRRAEAVDWSIAIHAHWLEPGQTEIVFN